MEQTVDLEQEPEPTPPEPTPPEPATDTVSDAPGD